MKESCPKVRRHHIFHGEAAEIEYRLICVKSSPIWRQDGDRLGNGVGDLSELHFVLPELFFSPLPIFDVGTGSTPVGDIPMLIAQGFGAEQEPAIFSIEATHARLDDARLPGGGKFGPLVLHLL